jgi:dihydroneopterin aldolase
MIIRIEALEISACVGVPDAERAVPQSLTVNLTIELGG